MRATQRSCARSGRRRVRGLAAAALVGATAPPALAASTGEPISLVAAPAEIRSGGATAVTGALRSSQGAPLAGVPLELQIDPYPYRGFFDASHAATASDGSFAFTSLRPDRNTRYRVRFGARVSGPIIVYVDAPAVLHSYDRGPGRTVLTMLSYHSGYFHWLGVRAYWYVARPGTGVFRLAAVTHTREIRPGVTFAAATVDPPAVRFVYRVCFNAPGESGVGPPAAHAHCPHGDFSLSAPERR